MMRTVRGKILTFLILVFVLFGISSFSAANVIKTVNTPSDGCVLVAVRGSFTAESAAAIKEVNRIRYEACTEGVQDPRDPERRLTPEDYVPVKWSSALEYIARVRAAEASLVVSHTRPNGNICFTVSAPDGTSSYEEVLAWNNSANVTRGIAQWYSEKSAWVNQENSVTGHYTAMINPDNAYMGLGCFLSKGGVFYNTTSGEFRSGSGLNTSAAKAVKDCEVIIEIQKEALSDPFLMQTGQEKKKTDALDKGDILTYALAMKSTLEGYHATVFDAGNTHWTSGDSSVAAVDNTGKVQIKGTGTVKVTASSSTGMSAAITLKPAHDAGTWHVSKKADLSENGMYVKKCGICGDILSQQEIPRIGSITLKSDICTYNGSGQKPEVDVRDSGGKTIGKSYYSVAYSNNRNVGEGTARVSFKTRYAGETSLTFSILPQKVSGLKLKAGKKKMTVKWRRQKAQLTGYEIEYSLKKDFSAGRIVRISKKKTSSKTIKKLKAKKKYYVRIRSYCKVGDRIYVSDWSKTKKVRIKK